ncbi:MAG: S-adenosylmethionine:tRNA ribosyltransferase-isomerase [Bacteroidetes bacterium]|nr:S-adenosylmethionine:tRNA ribosyltransferase-isomerase [Bacteroidota bacterium]
MDPKKLLIQDFNYDLPEAKIAKHPKEKRDESKLLIYQNGKIAEDIYLNIDKWLPENSLIIFNNTKVVEARMLFKKATGTTIEIFCLEPGDEYADITTAMLQVKKVQWKCLVGNAKKWKEDILIKNITTRNKQIVLSAKKMHQEQDYFLIEFYWGDDNLSFAEVLHRAGVIPLPPYMHRAAEKNDEERYQTVYARYDGSVAAPTAGLHFTETIFRKLSAKYIGQDFVTLHVGAGTFKPVKSESIESHEMHAEFFEVDITLLKKICNNHYQNIIAVGTTSLRTLESLFWMGLKVYQKMKDIQPADISIEDITIHQWDAYELDATLQLSESLNALISWMNIHQIKKLVAKTQIILAPPYQLKTANILVTNFHQPKSTLLLLVAAVIGNEWKGVYDYALQNNFRFLSYGDGCLFFANQE